MMVREKILVYGNAGSGKSYSWLTLAERLPEATFWVLDTDDAVPRMMQGFGEIENVELLPCFEWADYMAALKSVGDKAAEGDWVVVDFISSAWTAVQDHYVQEIFGMSSTEYFMQVRRELAEGSKKLEALAGWTDWLVIKKLYGEFTRLLKYKLTGQNVFATAPLKIFGQETPKEIREVYAGLPGTPGGEKNLTYEFHTVLYLSRSGTDDWRMTTAKDRERKRFEKARLKNFYLQYYVPLVRKGNESG